jgi:hypothetical protein
MPGDSGVTVVTTLVCLFFHTRGCGRIERPAFPAPSEIQRAGRFWQTSDASRREDAESCFGNWGQRHCEERSDEAIHSFFAWRDGLLRGACHRARIRATRWLAMTVSPGVSAFVVIVRESGRSSIPEQLR